MFIESVGSCMETNLDVSFFSLSSPDFDGFRISFDFDIGETSIASATRSVKMVFV